MDGEEKEKKIALSQSVLDIAEAIALKLHQEDLVVALNTPNRFRVEGAIIKNLYSRSHSPSRYAFGFQLYSMTQFLQMDGNEKEMRIALSQSALEVEEVEVDVQRMLAEVKRQGQLLSILSAQRDIKDRNLTVIDRKGKDARAHVRITCFILFYFNPPIGLTRNAGSYWTSPSDATRHQRDRKNSQPYMRLLGMRATSMLT